MFEHLNFEYGSLIGQIHPHVEIVFSEKLSRLRAGNESIEEGDVI